VSFKLSKGEILGLIGPNGSGKSTCVNLISGVYTLDKGEVIFDGKTLMLKDGIVDRANMGIGRTFQTPKPFGNYSVYDNIFTIALQKNSFKDAAEKTSWILNMTKLEPLMNVNSLKLPIEKRKWLDLARILALEPKLIMMDEVMAGLNPTEMDESLALIRKINAEGMSVLFIEHVMKAVVNICTRVIVLNEGKLLCEGEPKEVLQRKEVVEAYLGGHSNVKF
jgi:branched-chain amino acid transport system ATP-binding protein